MLWLRRFLARGVFWRQFLNWAVRNVPLWIEPVVMATWTALFLVWRSGRRGVMSNLTGILPGSSRLVNFFRTYRVFWNFANTIAETARFKQLRITPDWEFVGLEHFEELQSREGGSIILTAHMGSYDIGAHLFAEISDRRVVMVRAPEIDPQTRQYEEQRQDRSIDDRLKVDFSTRASDLALDLLDAVRRGEIVAIQGDRVTPGISTLTGTLFGKPARYPAGPFALAMTARVPIYPLFIVRLGRRRYRLVVSKPFSVVRTANRSEAFDRALALWRDELEKVIRPAWYQWFAFEPFSEEPGA